MKIRKLIIKSILLLGMVFIIAGNASALTAKEAGQKGMDFLTKAAVDWQNRHGGSNACFACHTQGMSMLGASIGMSKGYTVNDSHLSQLVQNVVRNQSSDGLWYHSGSHHKGLMSSIASAGLAFYDRNVSTDKQSSLITGADALLRIQQSEGYWLSNTDWGSDPRDILRMDNKASTTSLAIITLRRAFEVTRALKYETAYKKAAAWLEGTSPDDTQSLGFKMMGLSEAQYVNDSATVVANVNEILSRQNSDGGFGIQRDWPSSAYQTGVAVYSLRLAGLTSSDSRISRGISWLLARQNADGSWPIAPANLSSGDKVAPNMWPVIALGEFGELGVEIKATPEGQMMEAFSDAEQIITYTFTVTNTGNSELPDTFDLQLSGGYPGFPAAIDASTLTLASGESQDVPFTMFAPANLPFGFPVTHSLTATSQTNSDTFAITSVTSATPPPPPAVGHNTNVLMIAGQNLSMTTMDTARIAVHVIDTVTNSFVIGSSDPAQSIGNVNFFVGGVSIGGDNDADGDGVFEIEWTPGWDWSNLGAQSLLITYSGIDKPEPQSDLLFSFAITDINIEKAPITPEIIADEAIVNIGEIIDILPIDVTSPAIFNHFNQAIDALNLALEAYNNGDVSTALVEFQNAINKLYDGIAKVEKERCSATKSGGGKGKGGGNTCLEDTLVDLIVDQANTIIADIEVAIAILEQ